MERILREADNEEEWIHSRADHQQLGEADALLSKGRTINCYQAIEHLYWHNSSRAKFKW